MTATNRIDKLLYGPAPSEVRKGHSGERGAWSLDPFSATVGVVYPRLPKARSHPLAAVYGHAGVHWEAAGDINVLDVGRQYELRKRRVELLVYASYLLDQAMELRSRRPTASQATETGRMTYDYLRRGSLGALSGIVASQAIYVLTGTLVLNPWVAVLLAAVACTFYLMARQMEREIDQLVQTWNVDAGSP